MALPAIPQNLVVQQSDGQVLLTWNASLSASSYSIQRSTDGVNFSSLATSAINSYLDTTGLLNTQYWYQVAAVNISGTSAYCAPQSTITTATGTECLGSLRLQAQQRADRVNSNFLTTAEWNLNINKSIAELYDLLVTSYEDYYIAPPITFTTDGVSGSYPLPDGQNYSGAPAFYKLAGVDLGLSNSNNAWVTLKKFNFIDRNRFIYPQLSSSILGVFNANYRIVGNQLQFIPVPSAGQFLKIWYVPRLKPLLADTDIVDGVNGWTEYVIVDAAIKALQKEESDVTVLLAQKMDLRKRIEAAAENRDEGQPDTISNTRMRGWTPSGGWGAGDGDGGWAGF